MKKKDKKLLGIFLACGMVFLGVTIFSIYKMISIPKTQTVSSNKANLLKNKNNSEEKSIETKENKEVNIKISAIGDCTLGENSDARGAVFSSVYNSNDPSYFFENVVDILSKDDLTIANLEGALSINGQRADKKFAFRGKPEYTKILTLGSVEAVNLANNHSMDYGQVAFSDTKKHLDENNIKNFGFKDSAIVEKNGIKIGLLGYKGWSASSEIKDSIKKDITELKEKTNMVVVSFHWGDERAKEPNNTQKTLGRLAIDSGADLVLGHHPHVIQGIEEYNGKNIVYSLGNFVFGGNTNPNDKDSFIYTQSFTFDPNKKIIKSSEPDAIPVSISSSKNKNDYRPKVLEGDEKERVAKKIAERSNLIK